MHGPAVRRQRHRWVRVHPASRRGWRAGEGAGCGLGAWAARHGGRGRRGAARAGRRGAPVFEGDERLTQGKRHVGEELLRAVTLDSSASEVRLGVVAHLARECRMRFSRPHRRRKEQLRGIGCSWRGLWLTVTRKEGMLSSCTHSYPQSLHLWRVMATTWLTDACGAVS